MFKLPFFAVGLTAVAISAADIQQRQLRPRELARCANQDMYAPPFITSDQYKDHKASNKAPLPGFTIPTYIHVVNTPRNSVTNATVMRQFAALNNNYAPGQIRFTLAGITTSVNTTWATANSTIVEDQMKAVLRKGGYDSLNLYFLSDWNPIYLPGGGFNSTFGVCEYPLTKEKAPVINSAQLKHDGCIIQQYSMPGSPGIGRTSIVRGAVDEGKTAVHEVGHWLYLYHPFGPEGEDNSFCDKDDDVFDTPRQNFSSPITQRPEPCPPMIPTCPEEPFPTSIFGPANVNNYMDYSSDYCMTQFTAEQYFRMKIAWTALRQGRIVI